MDKYTWLVSDTTYDADRELLAFWRSQGYTTDDPCKAQLFYVPVFSADFCQARQLLLYEAPSSACWLTCPVQGIYFHSNLTQLSGMKVNEPMDLLLTHRLAFFMNNALTTVKQDFPYWNRR